MPFIWPHDSFSNDSAESKYIKISAVFDVCLLFLHFKSYFLANDFNAKFSKLVRQVEESGGLD